jgi:hypothetical protein
MTRIRRKRGQGVYYMVLTADEIYKKAGYFPAV